jgi:sigma-B regulation protein RsbQ
LSTARDLNARVRGSGPTSVVLLHGFGSDQGVWSSFVPWLADRHRVVTFDLPCAGTVAPNVFDLRRHGTLDGYAEDIGRVLVELACEGCIFVGHSVSGLLGLQIAIENPGLLGRLVLIGAFATPRAIPAASTTRLWARCWTR